MTRNWPWMSGAAPETRGGVNQAMKEFRVLTGKLLTALPSAGPGNVIPPVYSAHVQVPE